MGGRSGAARRPGLGARSRRSPGGERAFTAGLARFFGAGAGVVLGIGDDAAVVANRAEHSVLCCDPVVQGVHFDGSADPALVGRKAVNRNLADLAAMGAEPDWLLVSLVLPRGYPAAARRRLLLGLRAAARTGGCRVVGGDVAVADARAPLVVTVTAVGHLGGRALRRDAARVGDALHVTGDLGGSRAGHHLRFRPPLAAGRWLARAASPVACAIDVSDGLLLDLQTVLAASGGLGAEIDAAAVPVRACARRGVDRETALRRAFGDGEDHALLFTVPRGAALPAGGPLTQRARRPIGRVVRAPGLWLVEAGRRTPLLALGHEHELAPS